MHIFTVSPCCFILELISSINSEYLDWPLQKPWQEKCLEEGIILVLF